MSLLQNMGLLFQHIGLPFQKYGFTLSKYGFTIRKIVVYSFKKRVNPYLFFY